MQKIQLDKEKSEMLIEQSMRDIQTKLKDEIAQKVCFQKEAKDNSNLSKILEEENEQL